MIRAGVNDPENYLILIGLAEGNLVKLREGRPIAAPLTTFGLPLPGTVMILYGKTDADIEAELREHGFPVDEAKRAPEGRVTGDELMRREAERLGLGATGKFPLGKMDPADEGALKCALAVKGNQVVLNFGSPVAWLSLPAAAARELARLLVLKADAVEAKGAP